MHITVIMSEIQTDKSKLPDNMVAFRLPPRQAEFFDKMAIEFHKQGAIQKPNRHQLGKLAMLYLGGVWTEDLSKQQAKQQQEHGELDKQRSPIVADPNGSPYTAKDKSKYW